MIRFLIELYRRTEYPPERATAASPSTDNAGRHVSKLKTATHPTTGYWIDWGGWYDTPETNIIALYFDGYLTLAESIAQMLLAGKSYYRGTDLVYMVTEKYPWQYPIIQTELGEAEGFSSAVHDRENPSDDILDGRRYPTRLEIPDLDIKIPDAISGSALQLSTFSVNLINSDGFFDLTESNNFFNSPLFVLKSFLENPAYSDYDIIRRGFIDQFKSSFGQFEIEASTIFRSLSEDVHNIITTAEYPNAPTDNIGKKIPLAWGAVTGIEVIEVDTNTYIIFDPDYMQSIQAVYDSDGNVISPANYSLVNGLLVMTSGTPETADATSNANNKIGEIITEEIQAKSLILYAAEIWDTTETDAYISSSPALNLFFEGGSVRDLVAEVLKSDNAFLIEKSDGRLTLRKWGNTYTAHEIEPWTITQKPEKDFVNSKYFATAARVIYSGGIVEDTSRQEEIAEIYRKKQTREFPTALANSTTAAALATAMLNRYGQRAEVWRVSLGINTNIISLLDKVLIDLEINGRLLSNKNNFIVTGIDVAQDILTLEAIGTITITDGILSTPSGVGYVGDMAGRYDDGADAILAQRINREDT